MPDSKLGKIEARQNNGHLKQWLTDRYSTRRGFVVTLWHKFLYMTGRYRAYRQVDWDSVERLVFVCKGNICRSAYAEVIARSLGVEAVSCGLDTGNGLPANADAIEAAKARGVDLSRHKTTPIQLFEQKKGDLFIAMEPWQAEKLENEFGIKHNVSLLGVWADMKRPHIQDPYGASSVYFNNCFVYIEKSVSEVIKKIR